MPQSTPKDAKKLAKLSSDCSFLLTHLVRQNDGKSRKEAQAILHSILGAASLRPSPVGWFNTCSSTNSFDPSTRKWRLPNLDRSVCFTESTLAGLKAHRDVFKAWYGLGFDRDLVFEHGANPCLNIRKDLLDTKVKICGDQNRRHVYNFIPFALQPYVNVINESFDATHEREWRYVGEFSFAYSDVRFLFCPENDFAKFSYTQENGIPVLFDLMWLDRI